MNNLINSSFLGNCIGVISLILGGVSLYITIKTLKTAGEIQNQIRTGQIKAVDKIHFTDVKKNVTEVLNKYMASISNTNSISQRASIDLVTTIGELLKFSSIFTKTDIEELKDLYEKQKTICTQQVSYNNCCSSTVVTDCIDIIIKTKNIIEKGEYLI